MLTALEEKQILKLNDQLPRDVAIGLVASEHPHYGAFKKFCDILGRLVPGVKVKKNGDAPDEPPQILIGNGLRYQAVPAGRELQPFLEALIAFGSDSVDAAESGKTLLKKEKLPATLTLFIAPQCTFCPAVVRQLSPLPLLDDNIRLTIVDGTLFPEIAQPHKIQAVPTLLLDEQFRWTGAVPLEEIINTINSRDPASLGAESLENIIKEGQAGHLAAMMLEHKHIFPAFNDLLIHPKWPVRLGAMVVMEEIADQNPAIASEAIDFLWDRFYRQPDPVKGDILYLFGEIKNRRAVPWLQEVLGGEYDEEVKEAAGEALEKF
jgi:alkyl hydroperoxide reductase subunit AhpF